MQRKLLRMVVEYRIRTKIYLFMSLKGYSVTKLGHSLTVSPIASGNCIWIFTFQIIIVFTIPIKECPMKSIGLNQPVFVLVFNTVVTAWSYHSILYTYNVSCLSKTGADNFFLKHLLHVLFPT